MKLTFRWYGDSDPVILDKIRQIPAVEGIVSAVYDVPAGVWSRESIARLNQGKCRRLTFGWLKAFRYMKISSSALQTRKS